MCDSTPMNVLSGRDRLRLDRDCSAGAKKNNSKEGDQSGPREGRLGLIDEAYTVRSLSYSEDPSAWSYTVRGPLCQLAQNTDVASLINSSLT